jgi:dolichol-phosphate mannosyltransferase
MEEHPLGVGTVKYPMELRQPGSGTPGLPEAKLSIYASPRRWYGGAMNPVIVLPTYCERDNIEHVIRGIREHVVTDILIVDDNSPDGTGVFVEQLKRSDPQLHLISRPRKLGFASAYIDGLNWALERGFNPIVQMDSDFSHDPKHLNDLIRQTEDYDAVIGSKYVEGGAVLGLSWWRRALSRIGNIYVLTVFTMKSPGYSLRDSTSGYIAWRRDFLARLPLSTIRCKGYGFLVELKWEAFRLGARFREEPIVFRDRVNGYSKLTIGILWEVLVLPWRLLAFRL